MNRLNIKTHFGSCILHFALCILLILLAACAEGPDSSDDASFDTGLITFNVEWEGSAPASAIHAARSPSGDVCVDYGISTISAKVFNSSDTRVASDSWPCATPGHEGTISGVPPGSGMYLIVEGIVAGNLHWRGQTATFTVSAGQTTNVGTVSMSYIGEGEIPCTGSRYDLATPDFAGTSSGGEGTGRAIGFQAYSDFTVSSVGIMADLVDQSFDVVIYDSSDGHSAGSVLYSTSCTTGGTGYGWNDIPVTFTFDAGNFYVLNWRPTDGQTGWANEIDYYDDDGLPFTLGPLTILEGIEGYDAENDLNTLHPHLRLCEICTGSCKVCMGTRYDLATPQFVGRGSTVLTEGRAIGFRADSDFTVSSVGIMGDLLDESFDVVIYDSSDGHSAGSVLYSTSRTTGGTGYGWNDIPVSFTFDAGNFYVLNWRPTDGQDAWANEIDYYHDDGLPFTLGPLTILEGMEGYDAENDTSNVYHPHLRLCEE